MPRVGLAAGVGKDLPLNCKAWLTSMGVDVSGLLVSEEGHPTPRAWQLFEEDGTRTQVEHQAKVAFSSWQKAYTYTRRGTPEWLQVWRKTNAPSDALDAMLRPSLASLPPQFRSARNFHLGVHPQVRIQPLAFPVTRLPFCGLEPVVGNCAYYAPDCSGHLLVSSGEFTISSGHAWEAGCMITVCACRSRSC